MLAIPLHQKLNCARSAEPVSIVTDDRDSSPAEPNIRNLLVRLQSITALFGKVVQKRAGITDRNMCTVLAAALWASDSED